MGHFIDYLGNKSSILNFIENGIDHYLYAGDTVLDLFAGSGVVANKLHEKYDTIANDSEPYSATICSAILNNSSLTSKIVIDLKEQIFLEKTNLIDQEKASKFLEKEKIFIDNENIESLNILYQEHETVWNSKKITPSILREKNEYNLFYRYYAGTYFGLEQALEIDAIMKTIKNSYIEYKDIFVYRLFLTINNVVFSRDGHMAQPLDLMNNRQRALNDRKKSVIDIFFDYLNHSEDGSKQSTYNATVYNMSFEKLIKNNNILSNVDLIYADPPYTDMQYSRYYHILNVAVNYDYPELTKYRDGYTKGLYTEGRFQSSLSQRSKAKGNLELLMEKCKETNINLALSYAYPRDIEKQKTDRYTVSIEDLVSMAKDIFTPSKVHVDQIDYYHSNNKNRQKKPVVEYLIICGDNKKKEKAYSIANVKDQISTLNPTNKNAIYNTHIYWSQKSFNVLDVLIENFSEKNDVIFDPFMGSGVTILQAITKDHERNAIGCDLNEAPLFIVKCLIDYSKDKSLTNSLIQIDERLNSLMHYYRSVCPACGSKAVIERIIFDKPKRDSNNITISVVNHICDKCGKVIENDSTQHYKKEMFHKYKLNNINYNYEFIENSKVAVMKNDSIFNIFTNRNLKVLDEMLNISQDYTEDTTNVFKYILMSCMHQCKITDKRSNSQWPLWIPKKDCVERNVIFLVRKKIKNFLKSLSTINKVYKNSRLVDSVTEFSGSTAFLLHKPSQFITNNDIPNDSVDLVITDPPYLGQVLYSEYMQLYSPILGLENDMENEIVISSRAQHKKSEDDYFEDLGKVFEIIALKLKKDKILCLYFHDNSLRVWNEVIKLLFEEGFRYVGQTHIEKSNTLKNIISPKKSLKGDAILFFRNSKHKDKYRKAPEAIDEIELNIIKEAKHMLKNKDKLTTAELYDNGLMETLIANSWLEKMSEKYTSLIDLLQDHLKWNKDLAVWENFNNND